MISGIVTLVLNVVLLAAKFFLERAEDIKAGYKIFLRFVARISKNNSSDMEQDEARQLDELEKLKGK